ncbi:hypothetical protein [Clostridium kluyveri]|uniref:hypothetical protein n=1 Tax=Clostridium kluyveri TaxID=1534 RepID=UPI002245A248|nr:hypothetical protein [Clostridium kluyveri]UZQ52408.1 hypothetical protein OP486_09700 [Clostridium kluyveri]
MNLQVLKEYGKRTEYKVLEKFVDMQEVTLNTLYEGILLLPGILLGKFEKEEIKHLNEWVSNPSNQLILTPTWKEMNLKDIFHTSLDLKILKSEDIEYEGIECDYKIDGKVQDNLFVNEKGILGIHYRKDTGSGLLTVITLPILDYKQSHKHEQFRKLFSLCIVKTVDTEKMDTLEKTVHEITEDHIQLFMFLAANITVEKELQEGLKRYFNKDLGIEKIQGLKEDLIQEGFIEAEKTSDKGKTFIKEKKLKSFIRVLEGGRRTDEW